MTKCFAGILIALAYAIPYVAVADDAVSEDGKAAQAAVESFRDHLKAGKVDDAFALISPIPDAPEGFTEKLKSKLERLGAPLKSGKRGMEVVEAKTDENAAVVIIRESKADAKASKDLDPIYVVKQADKWLVLPGLTQYDTAKLGLKSGLDEATMKRFAGLAAWFKERKAAVRESEK